MVRGWSPTHAEGPVRVQAPLVQPGLQLDYWEAGGRLGAARSGMEIQNHWGHVDSHVELSVRTPLVCRGLDGSGKNTKAGHNAGGNIIFSTFTSQMMPV